MEKIVKSITWVSLFILLVPGGATLAQNKAGEAFEQALFIEESEGDLQKAIDMYEIIIQRHGGERSMAARAQLHIGLCYEKLGLNEAEKAYQNVLDNYPDQADVVNLAKQKISSLQEARHTLEQDGKNLVLQMISDKGAFMGLGAPSPDGRYVSYVNWNKPSLSYYEISKEKVIDIPNTTGTWEGDIKWAENSIWSPDSKELAYVWYDYSKDEEGRERPISIRIVGIDGSESRELFFDPSVNYPQPFGWSRDGQYVLALLFYKTQDEKVSQEIVLISVEDKSVQKLVRSELDQGFSGLSISPDGKYIAYPISPDPESPQKDIYLHSIKNKKQTVIIEHAATDFGPYWSHDGRHLIFFSDRTGSIGVWIQEMNGDQPVGGPKLVKNMNRAYPMGITSDDHLFMIFPEGGSNIYSVDLDPVTGKIISEPRCLIESNIGWNYASCFSKDGKYMAYVSRRGVLPWQVAWGQESLIIRDLNSGEERELIPKCRSLVEGMQNQPRWSPDGSKIIVNGRNKSGVNGQYLIQVDNAEVSPVFNQPSLLLRDPVWSPDMTEYYFYRADSLPDNGIYALNRSTGKVRLLYAEEKILEMSLHPDGRHFGIITPDALKVVSLETGKARILLQMQARANGATMAWSPDGRTLYFRKWNHPERVFELWRVGFDGNNARFTGIAYPELRFLSVRPNGKQLVFSNISSEEVAGSVWVMKNFLPPASK